MRIERTTGRDYIYGEYEMSEQRIDIDFAFPAIALLFIMFWGEPDLVDAIIYFLMK